MIGDETTHVVGDAQCPECLVGGGARLIPLISTEGLQKDYSLGDHTVNALRGVSVEIRGGEMVAVMGPSGSGNRPSLPSSAVSTRRRRDGTSWRAETCRASTTSCRRSATGASASSFIGLIGIGVGIAGSYLIACFFQWSLLVSWSAILPAFFFAAPVGIFFAYYPARKASRLNPIEALRYE